MSGVFVADDKIAAIGYGVKKWVSYHGFAFNINLDLTPFSYIIPCGITNKGVTTLEQETRKRLSIEEITKEIIKSFQQNFNYMDVKHERG